MSDCKSCGPVHDEGGGVDEINSNANHPIDYLPVAPLGSVASPGITTVCLDQEPKKMSCSSQCGCKKPTCKTCCDAITYSVPQPYYQTVPLCQEDHQKCVVNNTFATTLKVDNSWNIPDCSAAATLSIAGLSNILVGSYIWNPSYGYFQVISFNSQTNQITVQNNCTSGNASVGSQVPGCTNFVVAPPPLSASGGGTSTLYPYLAVDFTAPANGICIPITLTTTFGLSVGKNVQIGTGVYQLSSIENSTNVTICNNGAGAIPGTPVLARDGAGEFQYPVILIDTNPCTNTAVATGSLLVCNNGVSQPLGGETVGAIPVLIDAATNEVEFRVLNIPTSTCSTILCCLNLVPGQTVYAINVADSSQFTVGDLLQIGTRAERFTVTAINNATTITATIDAAVGALVQIPIATSICVVEGDCCEVLQVQINALELRVDTVEDPCTRDNSAYRNLSAGAFAGPGGGPLIAPGGSNNGPIAELVIPNSSACKNLRVLVTIEWFWDADVTGGAATDQCRVTYGQAFGIATGAIGTTVTPATANAREIERSAVGLIPLYRVDEMNSLTEQYNIASGNELRIAARNFTQFNSPNAVNLQINAYTCRIVYHATAF